MSKEAQIQKAISLFEGTGVHITAQSRSHLGAAIGSPSYMDKYVSEKVQELGAKEQINCCK